ncbi:MAG TPA: hypothetical protein VF824_07900 [Thermoanaerobaculia bacterium]|jgi:hypothetical protein
MSRTATFIALVLAAIALAAPAATVVPLNTGYDHANFAPYPNVTVPVSTTQDNYWINLATYPPTVPVAPTGSWVLQYPGASWLPPLAGTSWIGPRKSVGSGAGTTLQNPGYAIFRKCFCLLPNFKNASFSFRLRADDTVQAWFNTQTNVVVPPQFGRFNAVPIASLPSNPQWFRTGVNCLYVLVEDTGGWMGFDLAGTIQADGLMPIPAFGAGASFRCPCESGPAGAANDAAIVNAIRQFAEQRRLQRAAIPLQPHP